MTIQSSEFPNNLSEFIDSLQWTHAKTMPDWPHEYIVRKRVDESQFLKLVLYIRTNGYIGKFYLMDITYFENDGMVYWTMGAPIDETIIINRCKKDDTYEYRRQNKRLPD